MPVTKSAKRALRGSAQKQKINKKTLSRLEVAVRKAKRSKTNDTIAAAVSLADRAAKRKVIHKNKAARIKSQLSKLLPKKSAAKKTKSSKKASKK